MGDALVRAGRGLVGVAIMVPGCFLAHGDAVEPLGRMRRRSRPEHEDEQDGGNDGGQTRHR